jgi:hypothetical protein
VYSARVYRFRMKFVILLATLTGTSLGVPPDLPGYQWLDYLAFKITEFPDIDSLLSMADSDEKKIAVVFFAAESTLDHEIPLYDWTGICAALKLELQVPDIREIALEGAPRGFILVKTRFARIYRICWDLTSQERAAVFAHAVARFIAENPSDEPATETPDTPMEYLKDAHGLTILRGDHFVDARSWLPEFLSECFKRLFECDTENVCRPNSPHGDLEQYLVFGKAVGLALVEGVAFPGGTSLSYGTLHFVTYQGRKPFVLDDLAFEDYEKYLFITRLRAVCLRSDPECDEMLAPLRMPDNVSVVTRENFDVFLAEYLEHELHAKHGKPIWHIAMGVRFVLPYSELELSRIVDPLTLGEMLTGKF